MNLGQFFVHLGHVLGILTGEDPTETGLTTGGGTTIRLTTPVILDTTTLERISSEFSKPVSPKFQSTLFSEAVKDHTITGGTAKSEEDISSSTPGATTGSDDTSSPTHSETSPTGQSSAEPTVTGGTGSETTGTGGTGSETTGTGGTGSETTGTGGTGSETGGTGSETTGTGSETTETGSETTGTGSETTVTGETGSEATGTGSDSTGTGETGPTGAGPTDKPGLSRGAVAGIVIGCLLLVAVITSAIVFFVKNRGGPEAQRLRV